MPRDATSGIYTLPEPAFVPGTVIQSAPVNNDFSDIATALTQSVPTTGQTPMTGAMKAASGTAAGPSYTFNSDQDTGFYLAGTDQIGISTAGVVRGTFNSNGSLAWLGVSTFTGAATFNGAVTINSQLIIAHSSSVLISRNTTNDTSLQTNLNLQRGSGAGNGYTLQTIGGGANNITELQEFIGTTNIRAFTSNLIGNYVEVFFRASATASTTIFINGAGYQDIKVTTSPASPSTSFVRLYAQNDINSKPVLNIITSVSVPYTFAKEVTLYAASVAGVSVIEFTSIGTYDELELIVMSMVPSIDSQPFQGQFRQGGAYVTTAGYDYMAGVFFNPDSIETTAQNVQTLFQIASRIAASATSALTVKAYIERPAAINNYKLMHGKQMYGDTATSEIVIGQFHARLQDNTNAIDGFRLFVSSGTMTAVYVLKGKIW